MNERELKKRLTEYLDQTGRTQADPTGLDETVQLCFAVMQERPAVFPEPRLGFWPFLSGVFRFAWRPIVFFQGLALLAAGLFLYGAARDLRTLPAYTPLFALAAVPVLFQEQYFGTGELEAATRSSGAQLMLAKLLLSGAADLVCMTLLLALEVRVTGGVRELGRMILYCLVPYLVCMTALLRLIRRRRKNGMGLGAVLGTGSCLFWRASSRVAPGLYELSALGVWIAAFMIFSAFFAREIYFIVKANKEGKMYGAVI